MTLSGGIHSYLNTMAFICSILYNAMTSTYIQMAPSRDWAASTSNLHTRRCYTFLLLIQLPKLFTNLHCSNIPSPCGINTLSQPEQLPRTDAVIRISRPLNYGPSYTPSSGGNAFGNASKLLFYWLAPPYTSRRCQHSTSRDSTAGRRARYRHSNLMAFLKVKYTGRRP
jgi:hypothetical protein